MTGTRADRWRDRTQAQADLRHVCGPWREPRVVQTPLCTRILKYLESLFVFVTEPGVPATNNAAERSLRPLETSRKISGGTRSASGNGHEADARLPLRHLAGAGHQSLRRLPRTPRVPSNLNSYGRVWRRDGHARPSPANCWAAGMARLQDHAPHATAAGPVYIGPGLHSCNSSAYWNRRFAGYNRDRDRGKANRRAGGTGSRAPHVVRGASVQRWGANHET